jgi:hypothetical protein
MPRRSLLSLAALLLVASMPILPARAETDSDAGRIQAVVVDAGGRPGPNTASLTIHVESWSSDEEVARLAGVLKEKGPEALEKELVDLEKGWIRLGTSLGYPIAVARSIPTENGGRLVRLVVDRPLAFIEAARNLRTEEYPLSIVEIRFDAEGKGEGTLAAAVKAHFEGDKLVVESYGIRPDRIVQARIR